MFIEEEVMPMTEWKRDTARALKRLKAKGGAQVLTVNGRAAAVVLSPEEYRRLHGHADAERMRAAVEEALVARERGEPDIPLKEAFARLEKQAVAVERAKRSKARRR
jgi:prevent-host-death family protein